MFNLQLFAYQATNLVTVGQVKTMATRIAVRLTALESKKAIRTVVVDNATKTMNFMMFLPVKLRQIQFLKQLSIIQRKFI